MSYVGTVFVSAFLLFQIQPLISKAILPWFGGSPGVWTTCLLFFQSVLFAGYLYAHLLSRWLTSRQQFLAHGTLVALAVVSLNVLPDSSWKPTGEETPSLRILILLAATVGFPYFLLSGSGPLLQRWYSLSFSNRSPYRLYAVSNAGSLLALLSYPVGIEPFLPLPIQAHVWAGGFGVYFLGACLCGFAMLRAGTTQVGQDTPISVIRPVGGKMFRQWFLLAMLASASLLSVTNQICLDVAVIPFLWVVPLSIYLLSFIVCFESDRWYRRRLTSLVTCFLIVLFCLQEVFRGVDSLVLETGLALAILLSICMLCHGEIAKTRPDPAQLTSYYLTISAGGAAGGVFVAVGAPALFPDFWEFHLCLLAAVLCGLSVLFEIPPAPSEDRGRGALGKVLAVIPVVAVGTLLVESITNYQQATAMQRNFYGVLEVMDDPIDKAIIMRHGHIIHGVQLKPPSLRRQPTTYYSPRTGVGRLLKSLQADRESLHVGLVGLGAGTLAAYGRPGDRLRFYEINDIVIEQAQTYFTFLRDTSAEIEIVPGDARLSLEGEADQNFDVLVLDAFSGDAIPTHLLTVEAFEIYLRHVKDDGVIAIHISNLYFDLRPVLAAIAEEESLSMVGIQVPAIAPPVEPGSEWVLLSRKEQIFKDPLLRSDRIAPTSQRVLWTDNYSDLFRILKTD
ncbi:MAG: fused MFS/spermidine synthase [Planctomycetaceae bacterium]|nr:fused MFS/spermidine synthase [Planctomycetaceae bacterium]